MPIAVAGWLLSSSLRADLVGHWKLDETSGRTAHDATGKSDGQLTTAGANFVPGGISGSALQLDRTQNGYVQLPGFPGLVGSNFTVVVWAKLAAGDTTSDTYLLSLHEAWYHNGFLLMLNQVGGFGALARASFYLSGETQTGLSSSLINDGNWHQIVLSYDPAGRTSLYVDGGVPQASIPSTPTIERSPPLLVGGVYGQDVTGVSKGTFTGWIDDLQIYNQTLSEADIGKLFLNPGRNLQDLVHPIVFTPNGGRFVSSVDVLLESTVPGAAIRYTLDESEPLLSSTLYTAPIPIRKTTTIKARLFFNEFPVSDVVSNTFTQVPAISFRPGGGLFTNSIAVIAENNLRIGVLNYTLDGSDPVAGSLVNSGPLTLTNAVTLKARVFVNGFPASEIASTSFERVYALDDGVSNEWRERNFGAGYRTDPRVGAAADPDQDGWNNLREFQSGTDPLNKASLPLIQATIQSIPKLTWNSLPGSSYRVLRKAGVTASTWEMVTAAFQAVGTVSQYVDVDAPPHSIYLIEMIP